MFSHRFVPRAQLRTRGDLREHDLLYVGACLHPDVGGVVGVQPQQDAVHRAACPPVVRRVGVDEAPVERGWQNAFPGRPRDVPVAKPPPEVESLQACMHSACRRMRGPLELEQSHAPWSLTIPDQGDDSHACVHVFATWCARPSMHVFHAFGGATLCARPVHTEQQLV